MPPKVEPAQFPYSAVEIDQLKRVGHITPSSNTTLEPITAWVNQAIATKLSHHFTRIPVTHISLDDSSVSQFETHTMTQAATLLSDAPLSGILWNGTSGGWRGIAADRQLQRNIEQATGLPFSTSILAQLDAFAKLGLENFGLAVPYRDDVADRIVTNFSSEGYQSVRLATLGISTNTEFASVDLEDIRALIRNADSPDAECIVVICTNFPAALVVAQMEQELGKPVLDSVLVTFWKALEMAGIAESLPGWGMLLDQSTN